uniref:Uncharacterized protein n=1 Tax=Aegilops tauschii subsp. strangulata TaxID=200361 RepID=A0A452XKL4_AEGTS
DATVLHGRDHGPRRPRTRGGTKDAARIGAAVSHDHVVHLGLSPLVFRSGALTGFWWLPEEVAESHKSSWLNQTCSRHLPLRQRGPRPRSLFFMFSLLQQKQAVRAFSDPWR